MANEMLLITAPAEIPDPYPGAPIILNPLVDPFLRIDGEALTAIYTDGATVNSIVAYGAGPLSWRTFATKRASGGWAFPTLKFGVTPTGKAALYFDGSSHIANALAADPDTLPPVPQRTVFVVVKVEDYSNIDSASRIIAGVLNYVNNIQPVAGSPAGTISFGAGATVTRSIPSGKEYDWVILAAMFDASADDLIKVDTDVVESVNAGSNPAGLMSIGTNIGSSSVGGGFKGYIARIDMYAFAMDEFKIQEKFNELSAEFIGE